MITKWKLFNFKSVGTSTELPISPLTLLAGTNSSGKSTWIQSILLVSQTLSSSVGSRSVILNGPIVKLGQFNDLRTVDSDDDYICIGWECSPVSRANVGRPPTSQITSRVPLPYRAAIEDIARIACEITLDVTATGPQRDLLQLQPRLDTLSLEYSEVAVDQATDTEYLIPEKITARRSKRQRPSLNKIVDESGWPDAVRDSAKSSIEYLIEIPAEIVAELEAEFANGRAVGATFRHFLPDQLLVQYDQARQTVEAIVASLCDVGTRRLARGLSPARLRNITIPLAVVGSLREHLGTDADALLAPVEADESSTQAADVSLYVWTQRLRALPSSKRMSVLTTLRKLEAKIREIVGSATPPAQGVAWWRLRGPAAAALAYLDHSLSRSVRYIGPLRDEPKPLYPLSTTADPTDVGLRGEFTAAVLDLHKRQRVSYVPPACFQTESVTVWATEAPLESAVTEWLEYLGVARSVGTSDRGKLGHEIKVGSPGSLGEHDLTHVGVGVSQLLPIVVACLLAEGDTTLIFEQPELHLHPSVQARLGDFFLSVVLNGKQCLIETHSEYLIDRLRLRAAMSPDSLVSSLLSIYFVELRDGRSHFRPVSVNQYGAIPDWPEGFFDQSSREAERIVRAGLAKRRSERQGQ